VESRAKRADSDGEGNSNPASRDEDGSESSECKRVIDFSAADAFAEYGQQGEIAHKYW
jgi:hypothetical protein